MSTIISILGALLLLGIIILIHECGHFFVARWFGVKVLRFSIGFGRAIWSRVDKHGTEFCIGFLPIGGYVKMLGEGDEVINRRAHRGAFNEKSVWVRLAVVIAGPLMNFLLAIVLYWLIFVIGLSYPMPVIESVAPGSIAAEAGLPAPVLITAVDGKPVRQWQQVVMALVQHLGKPGEAKLSVVPYPPKANAEANTYVLDLTEWQLDPAEPAFLQSLGLKALRPEVAPKIAEVVPGSPAAGAGLKPGDLIVAIDGKPVSSMDELLAVVQNKPAKQVLLDFEREGVSKHVSLTTAVKQHDGKAIGIIGFKPQSPPWPDSMMAKTDFNLATAWVPAWQEVWRLVAFNFIALSKIVTGQVSLQALGGPVAIFHTAGRASQAGIKAYLGFVAFMSVTLGFINLLPIPGLDGGHLLFYCIEGVFRRPIPERYQQLLLRVGIILLLMLMVLVTYNDIMRLFGLSP